MSTMNVTLLILLIIPLAIGQMALLIAALISLVKKPSTDNGKKIMWVLIIVLIDIIGPILYFAIGSNQLDERGGNYNE